MLKVWINGPLSPLSHKARHPCFKYQICLGNFLTFLVFLKGLTNLLILSEIYLSETWPFSLYDLFIEEIYWITLHLKTCRYGNGRAYKLSSVQQGSFIKARKNAAISTWLTTECKYTTWIKVMHIYGHVLQRCNSMPKTLRT